MLAAIWGSRAMINDDDLFFEDVSLPDYEIDDSIEADELDYLVESESLGSQYSEMNGSVYYEVKVQAS